MNQQMVIDRLNELLELEGRALSGRLCEGQPFVGWSDAGAWAAVEQIERDESEHQRLLSELIVRLGGVPRPPARDMSSARMHYLGWRYLLPLVIEDERRRVGVYGQAVAELSAAGEAARVIGEILTRHQAHLERLEALAQQLAATEPEVATASTQGDDA